MRDPQCAPVSCAILQTVQENTNSNFNLAERDRLDSATIRRSIRTVRAGLLFSALALFATVTTLATAQTYSDLYNFGTVSNSPNDPRATGIIAQGRDGNLYSTSPQTWSGQSGDVFSISPAGALTDVFTFDGSNGAVVSSGVTMGTDGNFYGAAGTGGSGGYGITFKVTPAGALTTLHAFTNGADGAEPSSPPIQGVDGSFYGTASSCAGLPPGNVCTLNGTEGSVYRITTAGVFTVLHTFTGADGINPIGPLVQADDDDFYGTTAAGGAHGYGTVYKITPGGEFTSLFSFDGANGQYPFAGLILGTDGILYGDTTEGGSGGNGVVFKITNTGEFAVVHNFGGSAFDAVGGLVQATDGNLYGTTNFGGSGAGAVFQLTPGGTFKVVANFDGSDGSTPQSAVMQHTNGILYGQTCIGGSANQGVFYSLDMGLAPFVSALPAVAHIGQTIGILGQGFTGATGVSFNGLAASFKVESDTYLTAKIPPDATTGNITVAESAGTLTSNKAFRVLPQITSFAPTSGAVGTTVVLNGSGFLGATRIVFARAKQAEFTVNSDTQITATVPAGAQTGPINVVTPGGPYGTEASFTVSP
jgi:uncharacterized repeat protein (TIGR03803 family)